MKQPVKRRFFPEGVDKEGRPYEDLRWKRFRDKDPNTMYAVVAERVFPFLRTLAGDGSTYAHHMRDARFTVPTPGLLAKVVDALDKVRMEERDTKGDLYEYMLSKIRQLPGRTGSSLGKIGVMIVLNSTSNLVSALQVADRSADNPDMNRIPAAAKAVRAYPERLRPSVIVSLLAFAAMAGVGSFPCEAQTSTTLAVVVPSHAVAVVGDLRLSGTKNQQWSAPFTMRTQTGNAEEPVIVSLEFQDKKENTVGQSACEPTQESLHCAAASTLMPEKGNKFTAVSQATVTLSGT